MNKKNTTEYIKSIEKGKRKKIYYYNLRAMSIINNF